MKKTFPATARSHGQVAFHALVSIALIFREEPFVKSGLNIYSARSVKHYFAERSCFLLCFEEK